MLSKISKWWCSAGSTPDHALRTTFDFDINPNIDPAAVNTLASCEWIKKSQPLCLIGDSGTGKSHMLIALGTEAAIQGYRVRYVLATKPVNELAEAADEKQLPKTIARTAVSIFCALTNWATWNWTAGSLSRCFRF